MEDADPGSGTTIQPLQIHILDALAPYGTGISSFPHTWRRHGIHFHGVGSGRLNDVGSPAGGYPGGRLAPGHQRRPSSSSGGRSPAAGEQVVGHPGPTRARGVGEGLHHGARANGHRRAVAVQRLGAQSIILKKNKIQVMPIRILFNGPGELELFVTRIQLGK